MIRYKSFEVINKNRGAVALSDEALFNIRMSLGDGNNIEIGVQHGYTTIPMASALVNVCPNFKHYAIDPWDDASLFGMATINNNWRPKDMVKYSNILVDENFDMSSIPIADRQYFDGDMNSRKGINYDAFDNNIRNFDNGFLFDYIKPIVAYSHLVAEDVVLEMAPVAMLFIDGDHTYQAVYRDILKYHYLVKVGGVMIFDDWGGFGVTQGYDLASSKMIGMWSLPNFQVHGKAIFTRLSK